MVTDLSSLVHLFREPLRVIFDSGQFGREESVAVHALVVSLDCVCEGEWEKEEEGGGNLHESRLSET